MRRRRRLPPLYTIAGGLKPVSSGLSLFRVKVEAPDLAEVETIRQILRTRRCGDEVAAGPNLAGPGWRGMAV